MFDKYFNRGKAVRTAIWGARANNMIPKKGEGKWTKWINKSPPPPIAVYVWAGERVLTGLQPGEGHAVVFNLDKNKTHSRSELSSNGSAWVATDKIKNSKVTGDPPKIEVDENPPLDVIYKLVLNEPLGFQIIPPLTINVYDGKLEIKFNVEASEGGRDNTFTFTLKEDQEITENW